MKRLQTLVLFTGLLALTVAGCKSDSDDTAEEQQKPRPVQFERVASDNVRLSSTFQGTTRAEIETSLSFRTSGRVKRVAIEVGDRVTEGQLLAVVETTDQQLQVEQQRAQRGQLVAQVQLASSQYDRAQRLFESGSASASDLEVARTQLASARASLSSLDQQIQLLQRQVSYGRLEAPSAGAIASVTMEVGENVQAGKPVAELESEENGGIQVRVTVPESDIARISQGDEATVMVSALPEQTFTARVTEVGVSPTSGGGTFPVTLKITDATEALRPGMTATARFSRSSSADEGSAGSFFVDPDAVVEGQEGRFVWIAVPTSDDRATVSRRPVVTGQLHAQKFEVTSGLSNGDRVVTAGLRFLDEGQEVRLLDRFDRTSEQTRRILGDTNSDQGRATSPGDRGPNATADGPEENPAQTNERGDDAAADQGAPQ